MHLCAHPHFMRIIAPPPFRRDPILSASARWVRTVIIYLLGNKAKNNTEKRKALQTFWILNLRKILLLTCCVDLLLLLFFNQAFWTFERHRSLGISVLHPLPGKVRSKQQYLVILVVFFAQGNFAQVFFFFHNLEFFVRVFSESLPQRWERN